MFQGKPSSISIHAPLRERQFFAVAAFKSTSISIHAPLRERPRFIIKLTEIHQFQSTLPCGSDFLPMLTENLSFHFNPRSLAGATKHSIREICSYLYFNPRSLAGATVDNAVFFYAQKFQSTLPCGSDIIMSDLLAIIKISIHAPLRERLLIDLVLSAVAVFQSTLPCGSDEPLKVRFFACGISIHAPLRERPCGMEAI